VRKLQHALQIGSLEPDLRQTAPSKPIATALGAGVGRDGSHDRTAFSSSTHPSAGYTASPSSSNLNRMNRRVVRSYDALPDQAAQCFRCSSRSRSTPSSRLGATEDP
jgi:hypothetical protein